MKVLKWLACATMLVGLVACGGGGGNAGTPGSTSGGTTTVVVSAAADIIVGLDKNTLSNTGSDQVVLSVIAVNAAGNKLANIPVSVAVTNGGVIGSLTPLKDGGFATDETGTFRGAITSPGNKANREINVTVSSGSAVKTTKVTVVGSVITVTPVPGAPLTGQATALNISLKDANGTGISGATLSVSGSAGFSGSPVTDANGNANINGTAPASTGTYTIVISGSGVTSTNQLTVISPTGGGIPDAVGPVGVGQLNANPASVPNNFNATSNNRAPVIFKIRNSLDQGVQNVRVKFLILLPGLGAGERMSTGDTVVYTNSAGEVSADYIPGTRASPTNGVKIRACYGLTDLAVASCSTYADANLTVTGQAINLSIFDNNTLGARFNNTVYIQTLVVKAINSSGAPVSDAPISASVDVTHYGKGPAWGASFAYPPSRVAPTVADTYTSTLSDTLVPTSSRPAGATATLGFNVWCTNEDINRNGFRDPGEDLDGDGVLEARASDVSIVAVSPKTDSNGEVLLDVAWGQNVGGWIAYTVKVTMNVEGSEGTN